MIRTTAVLCFLLCTTGVVCPRSARLPERVHRQAKLARSVLLEQYICSTADTQRLCSLTFCLNVCRARGTAAAAWQKDDSSHVRIALFGESIVCLTQHDMLAPAAANLYSRSRFSSDHSHPHMSSACRHVPRARLINISKSRSHLCRTL